MSTDQIKLSDIAHTTEQKTKVLDWRDVCTSETNSKCRRCGAHVSTNYRRINGDENGDVFGCPSCYNHGELLNGAHQRGKHGENRIMGKQK